MNLKEKILNDFKGAFKGKDEIRLSVLKLLQAEIHNAEIAKRKGTHSLLESGLKRAEEGITSLEEILAVVSVS